MEIDNRRTKIICTLGPATSEISEIRTLVHRGMNVARLNFSHGTWEEHRTSIGRIRQVEEETGVAIGILQDLGGPKIRVGELPSGGIQLAYGQSVRLTSSPIAGADSTEPVIPISYEHLLADITAGGRILLDDGKIELSAGRTEGDTLMCGVTRPGILLSHKGVSFPDHELQLKSPTDADLIDLEFGLTQGVDFVAISFVQSASDIEHAREFIKSRGKETPVIAKIERKMALRNIDEIIGASDAVMVARGDLGVESEVTMVPIHQKKIVQEAIRRGKAVIIATQMLESMMQNEIPLRAEASDIAQAVYSGADATMLSGETSVGRHPDSAVGTMARIAANVSLHLGTDVAASRQDSTESADSQEMAIARSVCGAARNLRATCIIAHTLTGKTARLIAQQRPPQPIVAITPSQSTRRILSLYWGIESLLVPETERSFSDALASGDRALLEKGIAAKGDVVVVTAGIPEGTSGGTNVMKIHNVGF